ncbi:MAG: type II secretion system protein GspG [Candidatus Aerophobetes bacterium]|nr:type II secretion system protein GspG [Candidatus Aerophobetes bacterium]
MSHFFYVKNSKGFALMEILIVVGIIVVISGLITVQAKNALDRAKVNRARAEIKAMGEAEERMKEDTKYCTQELGDLNSPTRPEYFPPKNPHHFVISPWWGPYITSLSLKDPWGNNYFYEAWNKSADRPAGWEMGKKTGWQGMSLPPGQNPENWDTPFYIGDEDSGFTLGSYGSDGQPGGTGSAADIIYGTY